MKNRDLLNKKLDNLEFTLTTLSNLVNTQQPIEVYKSNIEKGFNLVEDIKSMIDREPMSPNEINRF